ncbi:hypothetical protein LTR02_008797 [Friedmanniomyces endolithicus]|nr:hypothetical protein LTR94_008567 [Friedmanniomyces endolithicus]KAK0777818.1 hypothetical protein LTR59_013735 [Friedmanniomyces endolithicus]KAK0796481.1 hypothetical protein LTR38_008530 [Friedmanniomyces endolithicus]KAK0798059.1 hypothetical protein LTR75_009645 [Friedmanniomyces endolithicus]KAK0857389.1 hypothetical protein LTR03_000879 [Friedmanniomyces endolithicus]
MTPAVRPKPSTWILRFKHHRTTILLHVDPLQEFTSIRAELLKAIQQTCPHGTLNGHAIPEDAGELLLARPVDSNDLSLGWKVLAREAGEGAEQEVKGKGKAPVVMANSGKKVVKGKPTDCPQAVGLRDGDMVAFKFRSEVGTGTRDQGEGDEGEQDGEKLVGEGGALEKWDVVVPTLEDTYGDSLPLAGDGGDGGGVGNGDEEDSRNPTRAIMG